MELLTNYIYKVHSIYISAFVLCFQVRVSVAISGVVLFSLDATVHHIKFPMAIASFWSYMWYLFHFTSEVHLCQGRQ